MAIDDPVQGADSPRTTTEKPNAKKANGKKANDGKPAAPATTWGAVRPLVLRLHFYAGLLIAPLLLIAAVSGLLYSLSYQAEKIVYRQELRSPDSDRTAMLSQQVEAARAAHPDGEVTAVWPSSEDEESTRVLMTMPDSEESKSLAVFVDPHTAQIRGELDSYGSSGALPLRTWLSELHRHLHLGEPGRIYSETAASWLWVVALGGLALWIGRRRTSKRALLRPERGATGRRRTLGRHGSLGMWAAAGFLALSATGLTWSTYAGENIGAVQDQLGGATPVVSAELGSGEGAAGADGHEGHEGHGGDSGAGGDHEGMDIGFDNALTAARQAGLDGPVTVKPPAEGTAYVVAQRDNQFPLRLDSVSVDPGTGLILDELRFADYPLLAQLTRIGIDAHMGLTFGVVNQLLLAALALSLILIIVWGYRMWWQRRPTQDRKLGVGKPMARGAWRKVPLSVLLPLIAAAALAGWFVPLLGITLVAFLVLDVVLGAVARARAARAGTAAGG
ncbi:PepSY domain-containing protein [Streptomyces sp. IB2014 016-6]|uniref:PepSY-associated TM helix domain-containing protein n=1 Tax=Streptomyces sp. IB2014 016-6 TaxID=2517818 RepID=UPI0011C7CFC3|nr:PepSY domain-containing protein [Streptomyces sp. IB2014 016-6]TXL92790.1 PepSY domain-containing protein [Streptomyces sp. IB2014 016-6]